MGRRGPARLHRPPARVEPRRSPIFVVTLARPELLERRPDWGAGARNFTSMSPRAAARRRHAELLAGLVPGPARRRPCGRSSRAPTASRCTRSRRSGCSSRTGELRGDCRRRTDPIGDLGELAVPETLRRSSRPASTRSSGATGRSSRMPRSSARASRSRAWRPSVPRQRDDLEPRLRSLVRRELLRARRRPALARARPVRVRPGAHPRGRVQHARQARSAGAPPGRRALLRGARRRRAGRRARGALPRGAPGGA